MRGLSAAAAALVLAACTVQLPASTPPVQATAGDALPAAPTPAPTTDPAAADVITGWLDAVTARDYERAATFFAPGARIGDKSLVVANTRDEIVAAVRETPPCDHSITAIRGDGLTVWVHVEISGVDCPFVAFGESSHGILIPVQVVNGKIICTCPAEGSAPPF